MPFCRGCLLPRLPGLVSHRESWWSSTPACTRKAEPASQTWAGHGQGPQLPSALAQPEAARGRCAEGPGGAGRFQLSSQAGSAPTRCKWEHPCLRASLRRAPGGHGEPPSCSGGAPGRVGAAGAFRRSGEADGAVSANKVDGVPPAASLSRRTKLDRSRLGPVSCAAAAAPPPPPSPSGASISLRTPRKAKYRSCGAWRGAKATALPVCCQRGRLSALGQPEAGCWSHGERPGCLGGALGCVGAA